MTDSMIDWTAWSTEQPPLSFADDVMSAVGQGAAVALEPWQPRNRPRARSVVATLSAAAVGTASLALLAAAGVFDQAFRDASTPRPPGGSTGAPAQVALPVPSDTAAKRQPSRATGGPATSARASGTVRDRDLRERLRQRLQAVYSPGVERDPHTGLTLPVGADSASGSNHLTPAYLKQRIREDFIPLAVSCYRAALVDEPRLRGKLVIDFMIVGDVSVGGIVDQAKINATTDIENPELRDCMLESMLSMVFDAPDSGGWVTVTYPFALAPD